MQSSRWYGIGRARYEGPHVACDRSGARGARFWMARVLFRRLSDEQATQERRADAGSRDAASVRPKALRSWLTKSLNSTAALGPASADDGSPTSTATRTTKTSSNCLARWASTASSTAVLAC